MAVFDVAAFVLQTRDEGPVVPSSEGVVHASELHLLPGIPEVRDQDLTGEKVPGRGKVGGLRRCRNDNYNKRLLPW